MSRALCRALAILALLLLALPAAPARAMPAPDASATPIAPRAAALTVRLRLVPAVVTVGHRSSAHVRVRWHGHRVRGAVQVVVHGHHHTWTARGQVRRGHASVRLPKLTQRGGYSVRALFRGSARVGAGRSAWEPLRVKAHSGRAGFPGPSNTGVPHGVTLTPYSGPCTITTDGAVISRKRVGCDLTIRARNVVIRDSSLQTVLMDQDDMHARGASGWSFSITDSVVDAGTVDGPGVCCGNYQVTRTEMRGGHNGAQCENGADYCRLTDSWIHGQYEPAGGQRHLGGFLNDGGTPATLVHNTITCDARAENDEGGCTGDVNLIPNFGPIAFVTVQDNYLGANPDSAYCTYAGATPGDAGYAGQSSHIVYTGNVFGHSASISDAAAGQPSSTSRCAAYGPVTGFDPSAPGNVWSGNRYDNGLAIKCTSRTCG